MNRFKLALRLLKRDAYSGELTLLGLALILLLQAQLLLVCLLIECIEQ